MRLEREGASALPTILPDFLCIGAPRAGTTWLHGILASHPDVFVPVHRKELHFFGGDNFDRGLDWYARYFEGAKPGQVVGEVTPAYLRRPQAAARIKELLPETQFVVMVRNPVDRAYSQYTAQRQAGYRHGFKQFVDERRAALRAGLYATQLATYLELFDLDCFMVVVLEHASRRPGEFCLNLGRFLGVDGALFQPDQPRSLNRSGISRMPRTYGQLRRLAKASRSVGLDSLVERVKTTRSISLLNSREAPPKLDLDTRSQLWGYFEQDTIRLESLTGLDLSHWWPQTRD
jgi:hypothetical protein